MRATARDLHRAPSSIAREVARDRCADGGYRAFKACHRARGRRSRWRRNERVTAARGRRSCGAHLRQAAKKRRKRYGAYDSRGRLAGKRHISERPAEIESRRAIGHWEIDTVMGTEHGRNSVITMVERATGYAVMGKLARHCAADTTARCIELIGRHAGQVLTITADNGTEFHSYAEIEAATGALFYFATSHHSWERGANENTNGLIRQYLPKRTSLAHLTQSDCDAIAAKLNSRPRKRLGYKTPEECYVQGR